MKVSKATNIQNMSASKFRSFVDDFDYNRASLASLHVVASRALEISPPDLDASESANTEILKKQKACLDCQSRLIYFDVEKNNKITAKGIVALRASYELSPYGAEELLKWRLELSVDHWSDLDDDLKKAALSQITVLSQQKENREWLSTLPRSVDEINARIARFQNAT